MKGILGIISFVVSLANAGFAQQEVLGKWLTQDKNAVVEIYQQNGQYYGRVVKLMPEVQSNGKPIVDYYNPDKSKKGRAVLGINTIIGFDWNGEELVNGKVYDPNNGKFYTGKIWVKNEQLKMRGYVGIFYRTETWTKKNNK